MASPVEWLNEFQVNLGTANTPSTFDPQVIGLSNGNYLVAWVETGTTGVGTTAGNDIVGKIFDAEGNVVRDSYRINTNFNADDEDDFDIAATNDGGFILVYVDDDISNSSAEAIRWEKHNAAGDMTNTATIASNGVAADVLSNPKVVVNNNDNSSYVTFTDDVGVDFDVRAVRLDATGTITTAEFNAAQNSSDLDFSNDAAININGELVSVYAEADSGTNGIEVRIYNTAGTLQHALQIDDGPASDPHVATLTNGNIVVTWTEGTDVKYRVFDQNLVPDPVGGGPFNVDTLTDTYNESEVVALPDGGFVIVWDNETDNTVQARRFNENGSVSGTDTVFTVDPGTGQTSPDVGVTADGRILFTWSEGGNIFSSIWDTRGGNIDADDYDGLPLNFIETGTTTANVIDTTLTGDSDADTLLGQGGDDSITGGSAADSIEGGAGNDTIDGGLFVDTVNGGAGNDSIIINAGNAADVVDGGSGTDTLDFSASSLTGDVIFTSASAGSYIAGLTFNSIEVVKAGSADQTIDLYFGIQNVDGGAGDDLFIHGNGEFIDSLAGGAGDDTLDLSAELLTAGGEAVNIDQGAGTWTGDGGTRTISGFEHIIGTQGNDTILGGNLADTIDGQGGDDFIDVGGTAGFVGIDVKGGDGNDTIMANNSAFETLDGGAGIDLLDTTKFNGNYTINLVTGATNFGESFTNFENVTTGNGNDSVTGNSAANTIVGNDGNDTLDGSFGNDSLNGGLGADSLIGGSGDDTLLGGEGNDTMNGGNANDSLVGGDGNDNMQGRSGEDTLLGGNGDDTLDGGFADDYLSGSNGNDSMIGSTGDDTMYGGIGDDTMTGGDQDDFMSGSSGNDVMSGDGNNDTMYGGSGNDDMKGGNAQDLMYGQSGADTMLGGSGNDTMYGGTEDDNLQGASGKDVMYGDEGNDTVNGSFGNDSLYGGDGNDSVIGGSGQDLMFGDAGVDTLRGGNSHDTLDGGAGADIVDGGSGLDVLMVMAGEGGDTLTGGFAADTFDFETGFGTATITDFTSVDTIDLVDVAGVTGFGDLTITYGANALINLGGGDTILLQGVTSGLDATDFTF